MHDRLRALGFGRTTGIDVDGEVTGMLPSTEWKRTRLQKPEQQKLVRRRDHLAGHRPGLQQLHDAADGQRHRHAGLGRTALPAAPVREIEDVVTGGGARVAHATLPPLPAQARARGGDHAARWQGVDAEGTSARPSAARAYADGRQDRHRAGGGRQAPTRSTTPPRWRSTSATTRCTSPTRRSRRRRSALAHRGRERRLGCARPRRADRAPRVRLPDCWASGRARRDIAATREGKVRRRWASRAEPPRCRCRARYRLAAVAAAAARAGQRRRPACGKRAR